MSPVTHTYARFAPVSLLMFALLTVVSCGGAEVSVTRIPTLGGHTVVVRDDDRTVLVTSEGLTELRGGQPGHVRSLPEGYTLLGGVDAVNGKVVLRSGADLAVWDLDPDSEPVPIQLDDAFRRNEYDAFGADLTGGSTPELIVVTSRQFEVTGTPVGHDERLEVWSLEGEEPVRLWRSPGQGEGVTSLVSDPRVVAHEGGRVLVWNQGHGRARVEYLRVETLLVDPTDGFSVSTAPAELQRDPHEADYWSGAGPRLYPLPVFPPSELAASWEVDDDFRRHVYVANTRTGVRQEIDGGERSVGVYALVDLDGDEVEEIVIGGSGAPGICNDTYTGYIGWAFQDEAGTFGPVAWSDALDGGLLTMRVENIDKHPGAEVIVTSVDSYCSGEPTGVYIFRFDGR